MTAVLLQKLSLYLAFNKFYVRFYSYSCLNMGRRMDIRPSLDDVERISRGQAAKKRGTGSRAVPHRLNNMERKELELAK